MTVDASAVARTLGIATEFVDLRGGSILFLPQRIMLLAQGATASSYSTTKAVATTALAAGQTYGFGSPIHLSMLELRPNNGDGVGSIPVDIYPLDDHASGTVAAGDITPSGTTTAISTYKVRVGGILSDPFTIALGAIDVSLVCHDMGQAISAISAMPVLQTWSYGTVTSSDPAPANTGTGTVTVLAATTAVPGDWTLVCTVSTPDAGTFTLTDPDGTVVSTTIVAALAPGTDVDEAGLQFKLTAITANDFIVGDDFLITVPATDVTLTSKWKGASANDIGIEIVDALGDLTFALTQPTGGATNPTVDAALLQVGDVWETLGLNALEIADTTALGALEVWGDARWGDLIHKPMVFFTGNTTAAMVAGTTVADGRKTDRVNSQLVAPGSPDLPFRVAARQLARIAVQANNNPPTDYASNPRATGLIPGTDQEQWDWATRDLAIKRGSSTIEVKDSVINISDVVTFYHPTGDPTPAYRYVVDIVKLQNCIYNTALIFNSSDWAGKPLIPNGQATVNPNARKPSAAKADIAAMLDGLGNQAIISDVAAAKLTITAVINSGNPKRLDTEVTFPLSGNVNIQSHTQKFGFFFGGLTA